MFAPAEVCSKVDLIQRACTALQQLPLFPRYRPDDLT